MPHFIIEYSKGLAETVGPDRLIEAVNNGAINSDLFEASHIRVRATVYGSYISGYGRRDFIHITLKILSGRTVKEKKYLSELVLKELEALGFSSISITVEVTDIDRETYSKKVT